jgi:hypothetical protein
VSTTILLGRKSFYKLALITTNLLDTILLETDNDSIKFEKLKIEFKKILISLFLFTLYIFVIVASFYLPFFTYDLVYDNHNKIATFENLLGISSFTIGSIIPFYLFKKLYDYSYNEISQLFHRIILDNYNIAFKLLNFQIKNQIKINKKFIVVSGLARCGTTALTLTLNKSKNLMSLNYSNMPLVMAPKLWRKVYNPKSNKKWERKHGDNVIIHYSSTEALDEYFFKVNLKDDYIKKEYLIEHEIKESVYENYLKYHSSFTNNKIYLTKNNNFILRYKSFRNHNKNFKIIFMFRDPISHSNSLLNQHLKFTEFQKNDKFILQYMNWLGHHEFGQNEKRMKFNYKNKFTNKKSINYWLEVWINYYDYLLTFDDSIILVDYNDFLNNPHECIYKISKEINLDMSDIKILKFTKKGVDNNLPIDNSLKLLAYQIFEKLISKKLSVNENGRFP